MKAGGDPAKLNPDLENERKTCAFDVEELARWWNGGEQKLLEKRERGEHSRGDRNRVRVQVCVCVCVFCGGISSLPSRA